MPSTSDCFDFAEKQAGTSGDEALARAWSVLESVPDPEIPVVSIRELGILRSVERGEDGALEVVITPTYSGCPAMAHIAEDIGHALERAGLTPHRIKTVLAPAWTTDWITDEAREKLRAYGIAPPVDGTAADGRLAGRIARLAGTSNLVIACPRCGSTKTEKVSQFGSTPCKASYRCTDCLEPFDYFKCI